MSVDVCHMITKYAATSVVCHRKIHRLRPVSEYRNHGASVSTSPVTVWFHRAHIL